jgi:hypothetical protein
VPSSILGQARRYLARSRFGAASPRSRQRRTATKDGPPGRPISLTSYMPPGRLRRRRRRARTRGNRQARRVGQRDFSTASPPSPPRGRVGTTASVGRLAAPLHRGGCVFQKVLERLSPHASSSLASSSTAPSRPDRAVFAEQPFFAPRRWKTEVETYASVVVVLSVALLLVAAELLRNSPCGGGRARYRHAGAGGALASRAGLPAARHGIVRRGLGPGRVREVSEREVSEA